MHAHVWWRGLACMRGMRTGTCSPLAPCVCGTQSPHRKTRPAPPRGPPACLPTVLRAGGQEGPQAWRPRAMLSPEAGPPAAAAPRASCDYVYGLTAEGKSRPSGVSERDPDNNLSENNDPPPSSRSRALAIMSHLLRLGMARLAGAEALATRGMQALTTTRSFAEAAAATAAKPAAPPPPPPPPPPKDPSTVRAAAEGGIGQDLPRSMRALQPGPIASDGATHACTHTALAR